MSREAESGLETGSRCPRDTRERRALTRYAVNPSLWLSTLPRPCDVAPA
jgi:hypothetical protein